MTFSWIVFVAHLLLCHVTTSSSIDVTSSDMTLSTANTSEVDYQLVRIKTTQARLQILVDQGVDIWYKHKSNYPEQYIVDFLCKKPCQIPSQRIQIPALTTPKLYEVSGISILQYLDDSIMTTIRNEQQSLSQRTMFTSESKRIEFFDNFRSYDEWLVFYDALENDYPTFVKKSIVGTTFENKEIVGFTITSPTGQDKFGIHLQALQHAREWLAPTTLMWTVYNLLENYDTNADAKLLLDSIEWSVVPIVNVDGYLYTWSNDRLWRKNRRLNSGGSRGVDLNRNWGPLSTWCTSGSSTVPSSDTYCGTSVFSEPETRSLSELLRSKQGQIQAGIDFHTYGPLLLWPWQYTYDRLPSSDYLTFQGLGKTMERAINAVNGQNYISEQGSDLYPHSGGFIDYNWIENGFYGFTLEGRGNNFIVPVSSIIPAGQEAYAGVVALAKFVIRDDKNRH